MTVEPNTTPEEGVTDNDALSEDDTSEDFDYFDPDEDEQDTEAAEETEETDDEADEVEAEDEAENQEAEDQQAADEDPDAVTVKMDDGTSISVKELKRGFLREADYTRKQQALSTDREAVKAETQRIQNINQAFVEHIAQMVPAEPDPSLALSDPNKFVAQKAQYDAALGQLQKLIEIGQQAKSVDDSMSEADRAKIAQDENAKLQEMFPVVGTEKRQEFFSAANQAALDLGFDAKELGAVTDHRMIALAHWAKIGMDAQKATAKAKTKVQAAPATPRKPGQGAKKANTNVNAMRKLSKTGSIHDAVNVDWD